MKGPTHGNYTSRTGKAKVAVSRGSASHTSPIVTTSTGAADFGNQLTKERWEVFRWRMTGFLWEEENLVFEVLVKNEGALAWEDAERGRFCEDYFDPVVIPTIEHEPWALKNIPIPHRL